MKERDKCRTIGEEAKVIDGLYGAAWKGNGIILIIIIIIIIIIMYFKPYV